MYENVIKLFKKYKIKSLDTTIYLYSVFSQTLFYLAIYIYLKILYLYIGNTLPNELSNLYKMVIRRHLQFLNMSHRAPK